MNCGIGAGRLEPCLNNIGGLVNVYLFTYLGYRKYEISQDGTTLLKFPTTDVYKYELRADANTFTSTANLDDDGISYTQSASFVLKGLFNDRVEINGLLNKRVGVIVETRLGHYQIMGLYNGCVVKSVKGSTGGGRTDFRGYTINIEAKELNQPFFIQDLEDAGFDPVEPIIGDYLLQENGFRILQQNGFGILLSDPTELSLIANYQFNNNLIDSVNGYNLTGQNINYFAGNAVFNGVDSEAKRSDSGGIFSFTDGTNDLPFRIETSVKFNDFKDDFEFLANKRNINNAEWQLFYNKSATAIRFTLFNDLDDTIYIQRGCVINPQRNITYNIVVTYDGSKEVSGLKVFVNGIEGTDEIIEGNYIGMSKTQTDLLIGSFSIVNRYEFNGQMDYLKIYK